MMTQNVVFDQNDPNLIMTYLKGFELNYEQKKVNVTYWRVMAIKGTIKLYSEAISEEEYMVGTACEVLHKNDL